MPKIIIAKRCGRLANRIILFANIIAYAEEHSITVTNFTFQSYAHLFQSTLHTCRCSYPSKKNYQLNFILKPFVYFLNLFRLLHQVTSFLCKILLKYKFLQKFYPIISDCNLSKPSCLTDFKPMHMLESNSTVFIYGWKFREPKLTIKHASKIRAFFNPTHEINRVISSNVGELRKECDLLVGVHVRRGDYDKWKSGEFFFAQEDYSMFMKQISRLYFEKNVLFLICSNEKVDRSKFEDFSIEINDASPIEDIYTLSECDLIIGPPSTFTQWASFYGKKPLLHIYSKDYKFTKDDFKVSGISDIPG